MIIKSPLRLDSFNSPVPLRSSGREEVRETVSKDKKIHLSYLDIAKNTPSKHYTSLPQSSEPSAVKRPT